MAMGFAQIYTFYKNLKSPLNKINIKTPEGERGYEVYKVCEKSGHLF